MLTHTIPDRIWKGALLALFGRQGAAKVLRIRRCAVCQGRLRSYTDPREGAASNRAYGVTPGRRCVRCGRLA